MTHEPGEWERLVAENPDHSNWYIERFRGLEREGHDVVGEARFVDAMVPRGATILDAGCGPGRVGGHLHGAGHTVVGVDVDPALIEAAEVDHPGPTWVAGNLADLDRPERFDVIVCAGNVVTFVAPSTRVDILRRFADHLDVDGRAVVGFGAGRGYPFEEFLADSRTARLEPQVLLSTWDLRPFTDDSDFLVAILGRA